MTPPKRKAVKPMEHAAELIALATVIRAVEPFSDVKRERILKAARELVIGPPI